MPSIKQTAAANVGARLGDPIAASPEPASPPAPVPTPFAASPFMLSSLPPQAATFDQGVRQFYADHRMPRMRLLIPSSSQTGG